MTKKHFEAAAAMVRSGRAAPNTVAWTYAEKQAVRDAFYYLFNDFNPRFDGGRFLAACDAEDYETTTCNGRTVTRRYSRAS